MYEIIYKTGTGSKAHTYQRVRVQFVCDAPGQSLHVSQDQGTQDQTGVHLP